ncbi:MAG TPA: ergothioneine biosynthesis protein EgtB [Kofleriaceae bacterium]|nr:ergothioneine biosynthesis protein EgtB [Kofleriaceae bacterium]
MLPVLASRFERVRARTMGLCAPLSAEDAQLQSMADASPAKWHLAHTSWFFETFALAPIGTAPVDPAYAFLFNSYYEAAGPRVQRDRRGLVSRPSLAEVHAYRGEIDRRVLGAIVEGRLAGVEGVIELGLHHEQQHQELILTDIKHALGTQPTRPAYRSELVREPQRAEPLTFAPHDGGVVQIGAGDDGFAFDNERPRHRVFLEPFELASRCVTNREVQAFIADGGYHTAELWLSDGWATAQRERWTAPLYWDDDGALYDLAGVRAIDPDETACHLSYYEADAIARWAGARLPTEAEWEQSPLAEHSDVLADERLHPGAVWQWTQTAYSAYPGYRPLAGALGEYNGKFMSGQMVLRGGSCFTPPGHMRPSYRNFFPPHARWQMTGVRFARDLTSRS